MAEDIIVSADDPGDTVHPIVFRCFLVAVLMLPAPLALGESDPWSGKERKPGPAASIAAKLNEEAWFVPGAPGADGKPTMLKARVFRPEGAGPFKVAIINHGSPSQSSKRSTMPVPTYRAAAEWFVARGYMVVLPLRRGYGDSGPWPENYGRCENPNYAAAGRAAADDIESVVRYLRALPAVRKDRVLLAGHSAGGFGVVALAQRNPEGVFAAINFAGGRGAHQGPNGDWNCAPDRLIAATGGFAAGAKVPSLWIYAQNDTFIAPSLAKPMVDAYRAAGGNAEYLPLPPFGNEGHEVFSGAAGRTLWTKPVAAFLQKLE